MQDAKVNNMHANLRPLAISVDDGVLRSTLHGDIFFSNEDGLAESQYVFLDGTDIETQLLQNDHLVIAETGFGTGLNLAALMHLIDRLGVKTKIDYISFEACPLTPELIEIAHRPFPDIHSYSQEICSQLPPRWPGAHFRSLRDGQLQLHLHYGEAEFLMPRLDFEANIWFLDGFSPSKNADLWSPKICHEIARLSASDAKLATFTVAASVRDGLNEAGFALEKRPGFGRKRDMLVARLQGSVATKPKPVQKVAILGGGIAGAAIAAGLRQIGIEHILIDKQGTLASAASGNPVGLQSPRLRVEDHPISRLSISAFSSASVAADKAGAVISKGTIALDMPAREGERHEKLAKQGWPANLLQALNPEELEALAGVPLGVGGLYYPQAQTISPVALTHALAEGSAMITGKGTPSISKETEGWFIQFDDGQTLLASHLVLAAGSDLTDILQQLGCPALPLQVTSGQLSYFPEDNHMSGLKMALHYGGYIAADAANRFIAGASFDRTASMELSEEAHAHNIGLMPEPLAKVASRTGLNGRVSRRLATSDRWPLCGNYASDLSIISALGARGLTLAPLLGEVLARQIAGRPAGLDREILDMIDPKRFQKRLAKNKPAQKKWVRAKPVIPEA